MDDSTSISPPRQPANSALATPDEKLSAAIGKSNGGIFRPVSKCHPCRVCSVSTGCLVADEGSTIAAICSRVESPKPIGALGHFHLIVDRDPIWAPTRQAILKAARILGEESET